jgi:hypothetical protein
MKWSGELVGHGGVVLTDASYGDHLGADLVGFVSE